MDKEVNLEVTSVKIDYSKPLCIFSEEGFKFQNDSSLFKFILYTSKVEIKSNSFMKMVFTSSMIEISFWWIGFLLFLSKPSSWYLNFILIVHFFKGVLGLLLLNELPKTYEIIEKLYENPDFKEEMIMDLIKSNLKDCFLEKFSKNKNKLFLYFTLSIISLLIDSILFFLQVFLFGKTNKFLLQISLMFIISIYIVSDAVYLLWFVTIRFTFPKEMNTTINLALIGYLIDYKENLIKIFYKKIPNKF